MPPSYPHPQKCENHISSCADFGEQVNGNLLSVTNNRDNTRSQNFTYDPLSRISTAQTQTTGVTIPNSNCWGYTFGYDAWGNLSQASTSGPSGCSESYPLSISLTTANQISNYCYDSAGNLLDVGSCNSPHAYVYDAENRLSSSGNATYVYDGDGRRVSKNIPPTTSCVRGFGFRGSCPLNYHQVITAENTRQYWYGGNSAPLTEVTPSYCNGVCYAATSNNYFFFAGQRIAKLFSNTFGFGPDFYFGDHLGSARVVTDVSGNILDDADFYPFGGERDAVNPTSGNIFKFTGYQFDSETGLNHASARHYNPTLGRFMSPDPLSGSIGNPQSWNRYSYVQNNPLNATDPSGMCSEDDGYSGCDDGGGDWFGNYDNQFFGVLSFGGSWDSASGVWTSFNDDGFCCVSIGTQPWWANPAMSVSNFPQGGFLDFLWGALYGFAGSFGADPATCQGCDARFQAFVKQQMQPKSQWEQVGKNVGPLLGFLIPGFGEDEAVMEGIEAVEGFETFGEFKSAFGSAPDGFQWHHIVEQTPANLAQFGPRAIHNPSNLTLVPEELHIGRGSISAYYSGKDTFTGGLTVRKWLGPQSFESQRNFGLQILEQYGIKIRK